MIVSPSSIPGSNDALPNALVALDKLGLKPESADYVVLTHSPLIMLAVLAR